MFDKKGEKDEKINNNTDDNAFFTVIICNKCIYLEE